MRSIGVALFRIMSPDLRSGCSLRRSLSSTRLFSRRPWASRVVGSVLVQLASSCSLPTFGPTDIRARSRKLVRQAGWSGRRGAHLDQSEVVGGQRQLHDTIVDLDGFAGLAVHGP